MLSKVGPKRVLPKTRQDKAQQRNIRSQIKFATSLIFLFNELCKDPESVTIRTLPILVLTNGRRLGNFTVRLQLLCGSLSHRKSLCELYAQVVVTTSVPHTASLFLFGEEKEHRQKCGCRALIENSTHKLISGKISFLHYLLFIA